MALDRSLESGMANKMHLIFSKLHVCLYNSKSVLYRYFINFCLLASQMDMVLFFGWSLHLRIRWALKFRIFSVKHPIWTGALPVSNGLLCRHLLIHNFLYLCNCLLLAQFRCSILMMFFLRCFISSYCHRPMNPFGIWFRSARKSLSAFKYHSVFWACVFMAVMPVYLWAFTLDSYLFAHLMKGAWWSLGGSTCRLFRLSALLRMFILFFFVVGGKFCSKKERGSKMGPLWLNVFSKNY